MAFVHSWGASTRNCRRAPCCALFGREKDGFSQQPLLVSGSGRLGLRLANLWKHGLVTTETRSETDHQKMRDMGHEPRTREGRDDHRFDFVAITMPPSGNDDYPGEVQRACEQWSGGGSLVFTSSIGVYREEHGGTVNEKTPGSGGPRQEKLLQAEKHVLDSGGCVVRLAGLYDRKVGAHSFWFRAGKVTARADAVLNLVHYDDAATMVLKALEEDPEKTRGQIYIAADGVALSRLAILEAAWQDPMYSDKTFPVFTETDGPIGKIVDNKWSREMLGWSPEHKSFATYMASHR